MNTIKHAARFLLRNYFAGCALTGMISNRDYCIGGRGAPYSTEKLAEDAVAFADAMLAALSTETR